MGLMIPKEMKYNLHYGDVRGDVLPPPHGTNTSWRGNKVVLRDPSASIVIKTFIIYKVMKYRELLMK